MNKQPLILPIVTKSLQLSILILIAGLSLSMFFVSTARADTPIFVRLNGSDEHCNGLADLDYGPELAPNCAVESVEHGMWLADSGGAVVFSVGPNRITIPVNKPPAGQNDITIAAPSDPDLTVSKSDSQDPVPVGTPFTYTVVISNIGPSTATGVELVDVLISPNLGSVQFGPPVSSQGSCTLSAPLITCTLGSLVSGANITVTVVVTPTLDGNLENNAIVSADLDQNTNNNTATENTTITPEADLWLIKQDSPDPVKAGATLTYTIAVTNSGLIQADNVVVTDTLPAEVTLGGSGSITPSQGSCSSAANVVTCNLGPIPSQGTALITMQVTVTDTASGVITNVATVSSTTPDPILANNTVTETTVVEPAGPFNLFLPVILKNVSGGSSPTPTPTSPSSPQPTSTPLPLSYVSDVAADPDTNQIFVASPRHDWVYVIDGSSDTVARTVPVGNGPTGLAVLDGAAPANNKVFVAHQYGANNWHPGLMAFGVNETTAHVTADTGYTGAAPVKVAVNPTTDRVYVSNYFDKLAVLDGASGPPENRLGWVVQKGYQGSYGIDVSSAANRVYLATRDTGELVVFNSNNDRLLDADYIPTHVKPPQACSLWSVAVNETTGHVFVPCPALGLVFVLEENQVTVSSLEALGVLEDRDGNLALVVSAVVAPWIAEIPIPGGTGLGEEGIAVDTSTNRVFITNAQNDTVVVLQDGSSPAYVTTIAVGDVPQGIDVNQTTQKVYAGNTGDNTVTVFQAASPFSIITTIPLTP